MLPVYVKVPSKKQTWAALYIGQFGLSKSRIKIRIDSSVGVIKYIASMVFNGSRFFCKSSTTRTKYHFYFRDDTLIELTPKNTHMECPQRSCLAFYNTLISFALPIYQPPMCATLWIRALVTFLWNELPRSLSL